MRHTPADALVGYPVLDEAGDRWQGHYSTSPCAGCGNPEARIRTTTWVAYTHHEAV